MKEQLVSKETRQASEEPRKCHCSDDKVASILAKYRGQRGALIPVLQQVQDALGYLPSEAMAQIARSLKLPPADVYGVATFYAQFRFAPRGKHMVKVCQGTACHVRGAKRVLETAEKELGVKAGGTTSDMEFSLEEVACFGSCGLAPVVLIDEEFYGRLNDSKVKKILGEKKVSAKGQTR